VVKIAGGIPESHRSQSLVKHNVTSMKRHDSRGQTRLKLNKSTLYIRKEEFLGLSDFSSSLVMCEKKSQSLSVTYLLRYLGLLGDQADLSSFLAGG
jgi:hypothetical protein